MIKSNKLETCGFFVFSQKMGCMFALKHINNRIHSNKFAQRKAPVRKKGIWLTQELLDGSYDVQEIIIMGCILSAIKRGNQCKLNATTIASLLHLDLDTVQQRLAHLAQKGDIAVFEKTITVCKERLLPQKKIKEEKPPIILPNDWLEIGKRWLKMAQEEYPWRAEEKYWTPEHFGQELQKVAQYFGASSKDFKQLLERLEKDSFWRKNAASPFGLIKKSANGLRKIDNMIASLRTDFERKQSIQSNFSELRKHMSDLRSKEELEAELRREDQHAKRLSS